MLIKKSNNSLSISFANVTFYCKDLSKYIGSNCALQQARILQHGGVFRMLCLAAFARGKLEYPIGYAIMFVYLPIAIIFAFE